jgi:hypothetical protein
MDPIRIELVGGERDAPQLRALRAWLEPQVRELEALRSRPSIPGRSAAAGGRRRRPVGLGGHEDAIAAQTDRRRVACGGRSGTATVSVAFSAAGVAK